MNAKEKLENAVDHLVDSSMALVQAQHQFTEVNLETTRRLLHTQILAGASVLGCIGKQLGSLRAFPDVKEVMYRQRQAGERLFSELGVFVDTMRDIGFEAQAGYVAAARDSLGTMGE